MVPRLRQALGFTLVELTTVLVLVGVLSMVATSRLVPASSFEARDLSRALLAAGQLAQRTALARTDGTTQLNLQLTASTALIEVSFDDGSSVHVLSSVVVDANALDLHVTAGSLDRDIAAGDQLQLRYASNGDIEQVSLNTSLGTVTSGVALLWRGASSFELCVAATGYAHEGSCT